MKYQSQGNALICGDFNLHHRYWDPNATRDEETAERLIDWLTDQAVILLTDPMVPTRGEAVLDLTMATSQLTGKAAVESSVEENLACGSGHEPILISIVNTRAQQGSGGKGRYNMEKLDLETFNARGAARIMWNPDAEPEERCQTVNSLAEGIQDVLLQALQGSTTRSSGRGTGQRWWSKECREAVAEHQAARKEWKRHRNDDALEPELREARNDSKKKLSKAVKKAKDDFYRNIVNDLTEPKQLFQAVKWLQKRQRYNTPPLRDTSDNLLTDTHDKIQLLMRTHVMRENVHDLEAPHFPDIEDTWSSLTMEEVRGAIFKPGNTTPGPDSIPNSAIKLAWPYLGEALTALYNLSLNWSVCPDTFKRANLCVVPKEGRRDKSNPRSYRLISLQSTLGKGLERVIAKRLAYEAVERTIIPHNYVCATPKRSATDLILSLVDEVEDSLRNKKETVSLATFDVKGAFDAVSPNRMVKRLVDQGWPDKVCRWVQSFLNRREADLTLDGQTGDMSPLGGWLPQGSPISSILFMLFMAPLFLRGPHLRGYADDGVIKVTGKVPGNNVVPLQRELAQTQEWCNSNGLELDMGKTGLFHITRKQTTDNPGILLPDGNNLEAKGIKTLRWLGVLFDRKMSFKAHTKEACSRASKVTNGMRILSGCYKGAPTDSLLKAVKTCVLPILTYGFQAWWPTPERRRTTTITAELDKVVRRAVRAALPIYRTTPTHLIAHAAGMPPMDMVLDDLMHGEAIRMSLLDPTHILCFFRFDGKIDRIRNMLPKPVLPVYYLRYSGPRPVPPRDTPLDKEAEAKRHVERRTASPDTDYGPTLMAQ